MNICVTGGAGYIGSHTCLQLLLQDHHITVIDNLYNSSTISLERVEGIVKKKVVFINEDIRNKSALETIFRGNEFDAVIHFAGLKAVGESVWNPLTYYHNNITGTINLLGAMEKAGCKTMVFSSSATVYGDPDQLPVQENAPIKPTNPYGRTKAIIEDILFDLHAGDQSWRVVCLRYFNPVGAHHSGQIGEDPKGKPENLMPYICQVASGRREILNVFGNDYPTPDGTGVRDYIHVVDLAEGHLAALDYLNSVSSGTFLTVNLGTGQGYSVLDMIHAFEKSTGKTISYKVVDRRPGDIASCYADPTLANQLLNWKAKLGIEEMCRDAWHWQSNNPMGYTVG